MEKKIIKAKIDKVLREDKKINKKLTKVNREIKQMERNDNKKIFKKVNNTISRVGLDGARKLYHPLGRAEVNGNYEQCLMNPRNVLSRVSGGNCPTIAVQLARNITLTCNAGGHAAFIFVPQAINDGTNNAGGTSPLWWQNTVGYTPTAPETVVGYTGIDVGSILNGSSFTGGRCVSAYIELTPNVSMTNAQGRIIIAAGVLTPVAILMNPGGVSTTNYSNMQRQDNMLANRMYTMAEVVKMQGVSADWIPNETNDILGFAKINFIGAADLRDRHPEERVIYGCLTGLPASASVNIKIIVNLELLPTNDGVTAGIFPILARQDTDTKDPIPILSKCALNKGNLTRVVNILA